MNADSSVPSPTVQALIDQSQILSATQVIPQLHDELANEESTFETILAAIRNDAPLARRVIDLANSAWFGGRLKVDTVEVAFGRMGVDDFYKVVVAAALRFHLGAESARMKKWCAQSETTARLSDLLAQNLDAALLKPAFLLGLLHDCGVPLMARHVPDYSYLLDDAIGHAPSAIEMESDCNQINHCEVGAALVEAWKFPKCYSGVIRHHHGQTLESSTNDEERRLLAILLLAKRIDYWCSHQREPAFDEPGEPGLETEIADVFRLTRGQLAAVYSEMVQLYRLRQSHE